MRQRRGRERRLDRQNGPSDVDLLLGRQKFRVIAIYAPHAGYDDETLSKFYEELYVVLTEASQKGFRLIIGGDFNTVVGNGRRGEHLADLLCAFGLIIVNDPEKILFEILYTDSRFLSDARPHGIPRKAH